MRLAFKNNDEVCHVWVHQGQTEGYSGNISFRGPCLMSYGTVIAKLFPEQRAMLLTGVQHSITTSAHGSCAASAARHLEVFRLPEGKPVDISTTAEGVRELYLAEVAALSLEFQGLTRKPSKARCLRQLREAVDRANRFCRCFGFEELPPAPVDEEVDAWVLAQVDAQKERLAASFERDRLANLEKYQKAEEQLEAWRLGQHLRHLLGFLRPSRGDFMRLNAERDEVETSQGATVPAQHVAAHAPALLRIIRSGRAWKPNGRTIHLGHYAVDAIDPDGTLHAGCHLFKREELERMAGLMHIEDASIPAEAFVAGAHIHVEATERTQE